MQMICCDFITPILVKRSPTIKFYEFACYSKNSSSTFAEKNVLHQSFIWHCGAQIISQSVAKITTQLFSINNNCFYAIRVCSLFILTCFPFSSSLFPVPHFLVVQFHVLRFCVLFSSFAFLILCIFCAKFLCRLFSLAFFSQGYLTWPVTMQNFK